METPRVEKLIQALCEEVDFWREEAQIWEAKYTEARSQIIEMGQQSIESTKNLTVAVLTGLLATEQNL